MVFLVVLHKLKTHIIGRFATVPLFGLDVIRHFSENISDTSQCPAWHFEDVLQVMIILSVSGS